MIAKPSEQHTQLCLCWWRVGQTIAFGVSVRKQDGSGGVRWSRTDIAHQCEILTLVEKAACQTAASVVPIFLQMIGKVTLVEQLMLVNSLLRLPLARC
jgi:hypothetical protein